MTIRIAIAGAGGFAYILATEIAQTANAVLVLSTRPHPEFDDLNVQVALVDYSHTTDLHYTLRGVDLVISTISGDAQLHLIDAAVRARVRTFVPSEFEGALSHRPTANDALDRGSGAALRLLSGWSQAPSISAMRYTVFSCGVLYECFGPGGLGVLNIGLGSNNQNPGDYLVNMDTAYAEVVTTNAQGQPINVSMTSVYDVARFIAAAIEVGPERWPRELRMRGDQLSVVEIVHACSTARGVPFNMATHEYHRIQANLDYCIETADISRWYYFQRLQATADGRYTYGRANLNELINQTNGFSVTPVRFAEWARRAWAHSHPLASNAMQFG